VFGSQTWQNVSLLIRVWHYFEMCCIVLQCVGNIVAKSQQTSSVVQCIQACECCVTVCQNAALQLCQKHSCKVATNLECFAVKLGRMCLCECVAECRCVLQCDAVAKLQHLWLSCSRTRIVLLSLLTQRVLANALQCVAECLSKVLQCAAQYLARRGGGLGSRPKKMYGERLRDGVEYHLMSPTPLC